MTVSRSQSLRHADNSFEPSWRIGRITLRGFIDRNIDLVVKFGGSLLSDPASTAIAIDSIIECADLGMRVVVVPGGGPTDKTIEALNELHHFEPNTHHRACARAQDQTGLMISDAAFGATLPAAETLEEVRETLARGQVPVLLPSRLIFLLDPVERTWDVTSDAIAAWFTWLLGATTLVIMTNVDGIYGPGLPREGPPIPEIAASELEAWGINAVDTCVPAFLRAHQIICWVVHGGKAGRLLAVVSNGPQAGTLIRPD